VPVQESVPAIGSDDGSTSPALTSDPITDSDDTEFLNVKLDLDVRSKHPRNSMTLFFLTTCLNKLDSYLTEIFLRSPEKLSMVNACQ
jgi:hypothetical protein